VLVHTNTKEKRKKGVPFFNKGLLKNPETKASLLRAWREAMDSDLPTWNEKIVAANTTIRAKSEELTKTQKKKWRETY
jgi:hypothetical protein